MSLATLYVQYISRLFSVQTLFFKSTVVKFLTSDMNLIDIILVFCILIVRVSCENKTTPERKNY